MSRNSTVSVGRSATVSMKMVDTYSALTEDKPNVALSSVVGTSAKVPFSLQRLVQQAGKNRSQMDMF